MGDNWTGYTDPLEDFEEAKQGTGIAYTDDFKDIQYDDPESTVIMSCFRGGHGRTATSKAIRLFRAQRKLEKQISDIFRKAEQDARHLICTSVSDIIEDLR